MRFRIHLYFLVIFLALALTPPEARAQDVDRRSVRVAGGVVSQAGMFGDDDPLRSRRQLSPTVSIGVRRHPAHVIGLAFEAAFEPRSIPNPHFDESVNRVFLLLGPEIGRRVYVRPTAGGSVHLWTGTIGSSGLRLAPAFAVAAGYRHTTPGGVRLHLEFVSRASAEVGAVTRSLGAQLGVSLPNW